MQIKRCVDCPCLGYEVGDHYTCNHPDASSADILYVEAKSRKIPKLCPLINGSLVIELDPAAQIQKRKFH